jgi:hypothetical protein
MPLIFEGVKLDCGYRLDLLVEKKLLLELKSVVEINNVHVAQTLTYLRLGNFSLGLLINFNVYSLKDGIRRLINDFNSSVIKFNKLYFVFFAKIFVFFVFNQARCLNSCSLCLTPATSIDLSKRIK